MSKLEQIEKKKTMPEIIQETPVGETIEIFATRVASFKSSLSRVNKDNGSELKFLQGGVKDNFVSFKRTA